MLWKDISINNNRFFMPYFRPSMSLQSAKIWTMSLNLVLFEPLERCWDMPCKKNRSGGMVRVFWLWCFLCHSVPTFVVHEVIVSTVILLMYTNVMQCSRLQHHRNIFLRQMYASWCKVAWTIVSFLTVCRLQESKQHSNFLTSKQFCKFRLGRHQDDVEVVVLEALHRCWGQQRPRQDG